MTKTETKIQDNQSKRHIHLFNFSKERFIYVLSSMEIKHTRITFENYSL